MYKNLLLILKGTFGKMEKDSLEDELGILFHLENTILTLTNSTLIDVNSESELPFIYSTGSNIKYFTYNYKISL